MRTNGIVENLEPVAVETIPSSFAGEVFHILSDGLTIITGTGATVAEIGLT